jgi:predicted RNase H-like nuclease (RuvC/YqgF family)
VTISEYNKLVEAENQMALVVSNLQAVAIQQRQELTTSYAKMAEFDVRAKQQESEARSFDESLASLQTSLSETLKRVDGLQRAVIKLSLGLQDLQSAAKPVPSSRTN